MKIVCFILTLIVYSIPTYTIAKEDEWGIAAHIRYASVPYTHLGSESHVTSFIPAIYFRNDYFFIEGTQAGLNLYKGQEFELEALLMTRYSDLPKSTQNHYGGDTADIGVRLRPQLLNSAQLDIEIMAHEDSYAYTNLRLSRPISYLNTQLTPEFNIRSKSAFFNSDQYAKTTPEDKLSGGIDYYAGIELRYRLAPYILLMANAGVRYLDDSVVASPYIDDPWQTEWQLGIGYFPTLTSTADPRFTHPAYLRYAHGWATPSNINEIATLNRQKDKSGHQVSSVFYGLPLAQNLLDLPLSVYFTAGYGFHWPSPAQDQINEYILALKGYWNFSWPTTWRFGIAEGISYVDEITYIEATEMEEKSYRSSNTMNYLDFSIDVNVGELFNTPSLKHIWFGYSLHHRSAIFESSSLFSRIKGGSNYNTIYLQFDLL